LKNLKGFQKLLKKQSKEKENLKKKHNKERAMIQKQHSSTVDKMTANHDKASGSHGQFFNIDNTDESFRKKVD
jgi:phosphatidylinositol phospholipase C beta